MNEGQDASIESFDFQKLSNQDGTIMSSLVRLFSALPLPLPPLLLFFFVGSAVLSILSVI